MPCRSVFRRNSIRIVMGGVASCLLAGFFLAVVAASVRDFFSASKPSEVQLALALGVIALVAIQLFTVLLSVWRFRHPVEKYTDELPAVSLIRPCCGLDAFDEKTLESSFLQNYPHYEVIFCVARSDDAAVPVIRRLMAKYRAISSQLLIGDSSLTNNPKVNNLVKAVPKARYDILCMTDANLLLPRDYLRRLVCRFDKKAGMVSSPAVGCSAQNFWGRVEAAMLNSHQARWQYLPDLVGGGFAQGKTLCFRREVLTNGGGMKQLGSEMAEDVASTKLVRAQGLKVRLPQRPFFQPIGKKSFQQMWGRQLRWARIRRDGFPLIYSPEILLGILPPAALSVVLAALGAIPAWSLLLLAAGWYLPEVWMSRVMGWPASMKDAAAMVVRDALMPALWTAGWFGRHIVWRGNVIETNESLQAKGATTSAEKVPEGLRNA